MLLKYASCLEHRQRNAIDEDALSNSPMKTSKNARETLTPWRY